MMVKRSHEPPKPKLTDAERHKRFVETAKLVGASDKSEDFERAFESLKIRNVAAKKSADGSRK
jgi:hypothetical protein